MIREKRSKETVIKSIYLYVINYNITYNIIQYNNIMYIVFFDYGSFLNHPVRLGRVLFCLYFIILHNSVQPLFFRRYFSLFIFVSIARSIQL